MRITLVITALGCGGAERMLSLLASALAERGHQVGIAVLHPGSPFFPLHEMIRIRSFEDEREPGGRTGLLHRVTRFLSRPRWLARVLEDERPDVVLSFIEVANTITLLASLSSRVPVVVAERTYPPSHRAPAVYQVLRRLLYPRARRVVVQTSQSAEWARRQARASRVEVIANPVARPEDAGSGEPCEELTLRLDRRSRSWLVSMGRLERSKGFDVLIEVFAGLEGRHPEWSLLILGEGPERARLEQMIDRLGLVGKVSLPGRVNHPARVLEQCQLFAFASAYEGFPNALGEAMACGLPAVSYDCAAGPRDIIRHGVDGVLVPAADAEGLADVLDRLMGDEAERARLAGRAAEVCDRFEVEGIIDRWQELLEDVAREDL